MSAAPCSLDGKVALVTGATSGVGRAIARGWAACGASIVATGRREELGRSLSDEVERAGGRAGGCATSAPMCAAALIVPAPLTRQWRSSDGWTSS